MTKQTKTEQIVKNSESPKMPKTSLIFVSHDSQDAELAEAFNKLVSSVSMGVLKVFRSSDTKGTQGIEYGTEWYPTIMKKLETASDVVCLLTERSIDRPWVLYEAGVAVGKLNTRVCGIALGIPLTRLNTGPFAQFQNCDDSEESLTKLIMQLAKRIPDAEPDHDAILLQVKMFKQNAEKCLEKIENRKKEKDIPKSEDVSIPKLFEEIKVMFQDLPSRIEHRVIEKPFRNRKLRHPMMLMDFAEYIDREKSDPVGILVLTGIFRNDFPWLYDIGLETYRAIKTGEPKKIEIAIRDFRRVIELTLREPIIESLDSEPESVMVLRDYLERISHRYRRSSEGKNE
jgi:hypothetical protein